MPVDQVKRFHRFTHLLGFCARADRVARGLGYEDYIEALNDDKKTFVELFWEAWPKID